MMLWVLVLLAGADLEGPGSVRFDKSARFTVEKNGLANPRWLVNQVGKLRDGSVPPPVFIDGENSTHFFFVMLDAQLPFVVTFVADNEAGKGGLGFAKTCLVESPDDDDKDDDDKDDDDKDDDDDVKPDPEPSPLPNASMLAVYVFYDPNNTAQKYADAVSDSSMRKSIEERKHSFRVYDVTLDDDERLGFRPILDKVGNLPTLIILSMDKPTNGRVLFSGPLPDSGAKILETVTKFQRG